MALANRLKWYLDSQGIEYEVLHHAHSSSSLDSGRKAHLPTGRIAKCVLLEDEYGYLLAVLPAPCHISFRAIAQLMHRRLELASESELSWIFGDCEVGAVPAAGEPYNLPMLVDESLLRMPDLYIEGGDHEDLVHLRVDAFRKLVGNAKHGRIGYPV